MTSITDIHVTRDEVCVTKDDVKNIFTYDEKYADNRRYKVVSHTKYESREYWEDRGSYAELETESWEEKVYFTPEELIKYYVSHTHMFNPDRHERHEEIMVAGKYYKELWDLRVEQIIRRKMDELKSKKRRELEKLQAVQAKFDREVTVQEIYRADFESYKSKLAQLIMTIQTQESNPEYSAILDQHNAYTNVLNSLAKDIDAKIEFYQIQKHLLESVFNQVPAIFNGHCVSRINKEKLRCSNANRSRLSTTCSFIHSLVSFEHQVADALSSHQKLMTDKVSKTLISNYSDYIKRLERVAQGHITEEMHADWTKYVKNLESSNNATKFGWVTSDNLDLVNKIRTHTRFTEVYDNTEFVSKMLTDLKSKATRVSLIGRFNRYVLMGMLTQ